MDSSKIRFGVIGSGRIGKVHIENLVNRISDSEVVALAEVVQTEREKIAQLYHIPKTSGNHSEIIGQSDVDAIVICSPTDTHYPIILEAAASGKHIFCEKPLDLSIKKIKEINDAVKKAGVKLMVAFNRRYDPNFFKVHEITKAGKIGDPHLLRITSRDPAPPPEEYIRSSGGLFLDMTIHDFDMARYLIDSPVTEVYAQGRVLVDPVFEKAGDIDTAVVVLSYENGAMATIDNSREAVYGYDQRVEVFGSEGMVTVTNNTPDNHIYLNRDGVHTALPLNFFMERYTESYLGEMQAFIQSLLEDTEPPVTGEDGLKAVQMGLAANKSLKEGRPVKLEEIS
ncbi:inositol 2-dehydrogenase [candidate division KSB1 bacterium]|nr:inositol 2-dehydrogenase [candidate division KSB1 bacterium]